MRRPSAHAAESPWASVHEVGIEPPPPLVALTHPGPARRPVPVPASRRAGRLVVRMVAVAWLLLRLAVLVTCVALMVAWRGFGLVPLAVASGSMEPSLPVHALAFVTETSASTVREGDIITFTPPGRPARVTHRVVRREERDGNWFFVTKGDANPVADDWRHFVDAPEQPAAGDTAAYRSNGATHAPSTREYTRGVTYGSQPAVRYVWHVPYIGRFAAAQLPASVRLPMVIVPLALITLWLLGLIWLRPIQQRPRRRWRQLVPRRRTRAPFEGGPVPLDERMDPRPVTHPPADARDAA